jgi:probable HAF family extracellular repeat protein
MPGIRSTVNLREVTMHVQAIAIFACAASVSAGPPTYTACVLEHAEGFESSRPRHMTDAGIVVGQTSRLEDEYPIRAVVSDGCGAPSVLPIASEIPDIAYGANDRGLVVGISSFQAVAWDDGAPVILGTEFEDLDGNFQIGFFGWAAGVNASGMIVGYVDLGIINQTQCVYWPDVNSDPVMLDGISDPYSYGSAIGVNDAGVIVGAVQEVVGGIFLPALWVSPEAEAMILTPPEEYDNGEAVAVNEAGDVVGRFSNIDSIMPFLYHEATGEIEELGFLGGAELLYAEARDVSEDQVVIGTGNAGPFLPHAFLWQDGVMHDLNDLVDPIDGVLYLSDAVSINASGQVLAEGMVDETPGMVRKAMVLLTPTGGCAADVNGDGALNILDFVAFQVLFVGGDPGADCDGNGALNILDFVCYQRLFQAGCP